MKCFDYEPDDELYDDETVDADEEYPREDDLQLLDDLLAFYERYTFEDSEDALGS
jgi:hypothetical protein